MSFTDEEMDNFIELYSEEDFDLDYDEFYDLMLDEIDFIEFTSKYQILAPGCFCKKQLTGDS